MPRNNIRRPETSLAGPSAAASNVPTVSQRLPEENLREYVHSIQIFSPPFVPNHPPIYRGRDDRIPADHFLLSIDPDSRFRLREIRTSKSFRGMNMNVHILMLATMPCRVNLQAGDPRDRIRTARFNLPAPGFLTFTDPFPLIDNAMGLANFVSQMMLETAEAVLNLVWPNASRGHTFIIPTNSVVPGTDEEICVPVYYTKVRESDLINVREPMVKLVVIVLPPWTCAMGDLDDIISLKRFPAFTMNPDGTRPTFTRAQKIWAQVYDCCVSQNCPFFALTNFAGWTFGAFNKSSGWTGVFCTQIISYLEPNPRILEWIIYWCASALKIPGGWSPETRPDSDNPDIGNFLRLQYLENPAQILDAQQWIDEFLDEDSGEENNFYTTKELPGNIFETRIH